MQTLFHKTFVSLSEPAVLIGSDISPASAMKSFVSPFTEMHAKNTVRLCIVSYFPLVYDEVKPKVGYDFWHNNTLRHKS